MSSAPLVGALLGVGVQLYVNGVRKLPLMRDPWLHVLWAGAGASFGTWLVSFEERTEKDLAGEEMRDRGEGRAMGACGGPGGAAAGAAVRAAAVPALPDQCLMPPACPPV